MNSGVRAASSDDIWKSSTVSGPNWVRRISLRKVSPSARSRWS